ncbi:MAG TPA: hypothetical protein VFV38_27675 [Ktedonobacteraceae bacterium]|nr:hypothetical protein [Ktedonobacteraceae bacterium]
MRQSDGSEILGPNDPRNLVIGIIHVTPGDDRQSVLTAISTQEKQGRDQIVLELPEQNRAFKTAVDFEGLRRMVSEIEASLVLVVPAKSKLATYARKESFSLYSSLDELVAAEFPPLEDENEAAGVPQDASVEDDTADHAIIFPITPPTNTPVTPPPVQQVSPSTPRSRNTRKAQAADRRMPADAAQAARVVSVSEVTSQPLSPDKLPTAGLPAGENASQPLPPDKLPTAGLPAGENASQPELIEDTDPEQPVVTVQSAEQDQQDNALPTPLAPGAGALVPSQALPPAYYYEPFEPPRRQRSWRGLLITAVIVLVLIGMGVLFYRPLLDLVFPPGATVTIVPDSQRVQHAYQITAVLGIPDPTKDQVDARALYASSQPQSSTVKATGQGHTQGQQARGELTFYNVTTSPQMVPAGTVMFDAHNIAVVNEHTLTLPAFDPTLGSQGVTDSAHTIDVGSKQNIAAGDLNRTLCCGGGVYVNNLAAFSGGQDPHAYTYVQQSDIDGAAQGIEATLARQATQTLQGQARPNERPVGQPQCSPQVRSNAQAGEQASTVTVTVTTSCLGEVYDMQAVQVLAVRKLGQDASAHPGSSYAPVGNVLTQVTQTTPDPHGSGNVLLVVTAAGVWAYQFNDAQRISLAHMIAGKNSADARSLLQHQPGVHDALITLTGAGATTVPGDVKHITLNIEAVQGLHT